MEDCYKGFVEGVWSREINVRDFIQKNYTPYDGDDSFLAGPTEATLKLWDQVMELSRQEASWIWIPRSSRRSLPTARVI